MSQNLNTTEMFLVYQDTHGRLFHQPYGEVVMNGTLIDDEGEDMDVIGWTLPESDTVNTSEMFLVYEDSQGEHHDQPYGTVVENGTLIDDEGDDMDIIGWALPNQA